MAVAVQGSSGTGSFSARDYEHSSDRTYLYCNPLQMAQTLHKFKIVYFQITK